MRKFIGRLSLLLAFGWAGSASAALMAPVNVNGLEWLQPLDFIGYSWNDISTVCSQETGICSGSLAGGQDLTGWTWADVGTVNAMFNYFIGSEEFGVAPGIYHENNSSWAPAMLSTFIQTDSFTGAVNVFGWTRSPYSDPYAAHLGQVYNYEKYGPADLLNTGNAISKETALSTNGAWFVRTAGVPTPATLPLLALGLAALGYSRRTRKQHKPNTEMELQS